MKNDDSVFCPLIDRNIDIVDCMENRDTTEASIPAEYKAKSNWKTICQNCANQKYESNILFSANRRK